MLHGIKNKREYFCLFSSKEEVISASSTGSALTGRPLLPMMFFIPVVLQDVSTVMT